MFKNVTFSVRNFRESWKVEMKKKKKQIYKISKIPPEWGIVQYQVIYCMAMIGW